MAARIGPGRRTLIAAPRGAVMFACACLWSVASDAEIVVETAINSEPSGAHVTLLKGLKRIELGQTPLVHELRYHSDRSELRLEVRSPGFETGVYRVGPKNAMLNASLVAADWLKDPASLPDRHLRLAQQDARERLHADWTAAFADSGEIHQDGEAVVRSAGDRYLLVAPVITGYKPDDAALSAFVGKLAARVAPFLAASERLDAVVLTARNADATGVAVGTRQVSEMACQGGMVTTTVWEACKTVATSTSRTASGNRVETKCVPGNVQRQIFDRCARRVPVTRTEIDFRNTYSTGSSSGLRWVIDATGYGGCRIENGKPAEIWGHADPENISAACGQ